MLNRFMNGDFFNFKSSQSQQNNPVLQDKIKHYLKETGRRHPVLKDQSLPSILKYKFLQIVSAPFIYLCFIPTLAMDILVTLYQRVCFPLYGIPLVTRRDYVVIDRHKLKYLNLSKKINCVYCGYFTGVIAYAQEVAGRSEQYWCPIKHAAKLKNPHNHYKNFFDYGNAKGYQEGFINIRKFNDQPTTRQNAGHEPDHTHPRPVAKPGEPPVANKNLHHDNRAMHNPSITSSIRPNNKNHNIRRHE